jgi:hypothetical protein
MLLSQTSFTTDERSPRKRIVRIKGQVDGRFIYQTLPGAPAAPSEFSDDTLVRGGQSACPAFSADIVTLSIETLSLKSSRGVLSYMAKTSFPVDDLLRPRIGSKQQELVVHSVFPPFF